MKTHVVATLAAMLVMLPIDAVWLNLVAKGFYTRHIGHLFAASPNLVPAGVFYVLYAAVLALLVVVPAVSGGWSPGKVYLYGAALGLAAYGAYDLTNHTTLRDWPLVMTVVDMVWGAVVTGVVAAAAAVITKYVT